MMINYNYVLDAIEDNNQRYLLDGSIALIEPVHPSLSWASSHVMKSKY